MLSTRLHISLLALALLAATSCLRPSSSEQVVAQVYDHKLLAADLEGLATQGLSADDSALLVQHYIDQWIMQTTMLAKAEKNIKTNFDNELQNYKNSLLIHAYEQRIVDQLLDTTVSDSEIAAYYEAHPNDFTLTSSIVKALYVKVPSKYSVLPKLRNIISKSSFGDAEVLELRQLASRHSLDCNLDIDTWMPFSTLQAEVPVRAYNEELFLKKNRSIAVSDDTCTYLLRILEYRTSSEAAPLELQHSNIKAIIVNHRKVELIRNMQNDLLREAEEGGHIKRF